jgi:hypothetical protein
MNFLIMPEMGIFPEGTEPYGPNQDSNVSYFYKISIPIVVISAIAIIIGEFGSIFVGWFRRLTHKVERKVSQLSIVSSPPPPPPSLVLQSYSITDTRLRLHLLLSFLAETSQSDSHASQEGHRPEKKETVMID